MTTPPPTTDPVMRFSTLNGALVAVYEDELGGWFRWFCHGCRDGEAQTERNVRKAANAHAGICRALPPE